MSEADWWICGHCKSLNNLSARKCYSCATRKPKTAERLSHLLGHLPVVEWNGRVRFEEQERPAQDEVKAEAPPPLREPPMRNIVELAPPLPEGARITYQSIEPPSASTIPPPPHDREPMVALPIATNDRPLATATPPLVPAGTDPGSRSFRRSLFRRHDAQPPAPLVPDLKPDDPRARIVQHNGPWPHWKEILDVATPDADQLRGAVTSTSPDLPDSALAEQLQGSSLRSALRTARQHADPDTGADRLVRPARDDATKGRGNPPARTLLARFSARTDTH